MFALVPEYLEVGIRPMGLEAGKLVECLWVANFHKGGEGQGFGVGLVGWVGWGTGGGINGRSGLRGGGGYEGGGGLGSGGG